MAESDKYLANQESIKELEYNEKELEDYLKSVKINWANFKNAYEFFDDIKKDKNWNNLNLKTVRTIAKDILEKYNDQWNKTETKRNIYEKYMSQSQHKNLKFISGFWSLIKDYIIPFFEKKIKNLSKPKLKILEELEKDRLVDIYKYNIQGNKKLKDFYDYQLKNKLDNDWDLVLYIRYLEKEFYKIKTWTKSEKFKQAFKKVFWDDSKYKINPDIVEIQWAEDFFEKLMSLWRNKIVKKIKTTLLTLDDYTEEMYQNDLRKIENYINSRLEIENKNANNSLNENEIKTIISEAISKLENINDYHNKITEKLIKDLETKYL